MTPFTPLPHADRVLYSEDLAQSGMYLSDDDLPELALSLDQIQPDETYAVFVRLDTTASRPMGMIPFDVVDDGTLDPDLIDEGSEAFCLSQVHHFAGFMTVAAFLADDSAQVRRGVVELAEKYPQLLSASLRGVFARRFPIPRPT